MRENRCIICNEVVPEGKMICPKCECIEPSFDTIKVTVLLNKLKDIIKFIRLVSKCPDDVVIKSGRYSVNAKSIVCLLSIDLSIPLKLEFYGIIPYKVKEGIKEFIMN